jgi:hypothetical protein
MFSARRSYSSSTSCSKGESSSFKALESAVASAEVSITSSALVEGRGGCLVGEMKLAECCVTDAL